MLSPPGTTMTSGGDVIKVFSVVVGSVVDGDVVDRGDVVVGKEVDVVGSGSLGEPVCVCVCVCVCSHVCISHAPY